MGTYNSLVAQEENVEQQWAQVENQYQRRADLVPNLVATVKGYAAHETETLQAVTESRSQVGKMQISPETLNNPAAFAQFQQAQAGLTSALSRLMLVVERYPDLKANTNFIRLQDELAGTENRIAVERRRYNETVKVYNIRIRKFPTNLFAGMFGFEKAAFFEVPKERQEAPKVKF